MHRQVLIRNRIALAIALTLVMAAFSFIDDINSHVAGSSEQIIQLARGIWLILVPVSLAVWIHAFWLWPGWRALLLISTVACIMFFYSYLGVGLASDVFIGTPKPTYANEYVLQFAILGAASVAFFVMFVASLVVIAYRVWSRQKELPGTSNDPL